MSLMIGLAEIEFLNLKDFECRFLLLILYSVVALLSHIAMLLQIG